jgi:hypothetical protein
MSLLARGLQHWRGLQSEAAPTTFPPSSLSTGRAFILYHTPYHMREHRDACLVLCLSRQFHGSPSLGTCNTSSTKIARGPVGAASGMPRHVPQQVAGFKPLFRLSVRCKSFSSLLQLLVLLMAQRYTESMMQLMSCSCIHDPWRANDASMTAHGAQLLNHTPLGLRI